MLSVREGVQILQLNMFFVYQAGSPAPCFHPGLCRSTEPRSSERTNAAASFSWYSAASWASPPSVASPDPEESRAWRAETTLQAPCSWIVLHGDKLRENCLRNRIIREGTIRKCSYIKMEMGLTFSAVYRITKRQIYSVAFNRRLFHNVANPLFNLSHSFWCIFY